MSKYKASIYNFVFNTINSIIIIVNGIIMVPIYLRYMTVSTYGAWLATGNLIAMLGLLEGGFGCVITQKMATAIGSHNDAEYQKLAGANIITAILIPTIMLIGGLIISPFVTDWINVDSTIADEIRYAFIIALLSTCISMTVSLLCSFPQVWQDTKTLNIISTITGLISIASLIIFLLLGFGVCSIAMGYLVRSSLNLIFQGNWIIHKQKREHILPPKFELYHSLVVIKDCLYPFLSKIANVLMGNSQSFIIALFMNPTLAAVYDLTAKVCYVACGFVSQINGSFFALFSLTLSSGNRTEITNVFKNTTQLLIISLVIISVYSICFTESIIHYWVGLDKFGGIWLVIILVAAKILFQFRTYCNTILYTGGLINMSAKLDILCAFTYLGLLLAIIQPAQIYAIPIAILVVNTIFIVWYIRLLKKDLSIDIKLMVSDIIKSMVILIPFIAFHYILHVPYHNPCLYVSYFIVFSVMFFIVMYKTYQTFFSLLLFKIHKRLS